MVESGKYDAVVCLGAVIRGATPHFDMVANEATKGVAHVGLQTGVPVIFGILTTDSIEQAVERAGTKAGNKGFDAMTTAIIAVPGGNLVAPPKLAGNAPIMDVFHPIDISLGEALGYELNGSVLHHADGLLGQGRHLHEPLGGD